MLINVKIAFRHCKIKYTVVIPIISNTFNDLTKGSVIKKQKKIITNILSCEK